ncbi:MAG: hypothetical protein JZU50_05740 [Desulfobulbaceae bacterium]|nr:hypothetical protein [Desulfobulbaceae bacterium]
MLATDGHQVDLVLRPRFISTLNTEGLSVTEVFGEYQVTAHQLGLIGGPRGTRWPGL